MQQADQIEPFLGLDLQVFTDVIACGTPERRTELARQIAALLADPATPAAERSQVKPVALELAADADPGVRLALALALTDAKDLDSDILFTIVADEEEVALPFITASAAIDTPRAIAILRAGDAPRQAVIAARGGFGPEVIGLITRDCAASVNAILLENQAFSLTAAHYHTLYDRFGEDRDMLDLLLSMPGLPPVIRIVQARKAAANLTVMLAGRGWLPANSSDVMADAEENATLGVLINADPEQLPGAIAYLIDNEFLTPALIVHAACLGAMDVVAECMAGLAGIPKRRAEQQMYNGGKLRGLFERCGLPESCYWTLKAACDVTSEERRQGLFFTAEDFGRRLIEILLTRYDGLPVAEQPRHLAFISRFAAERARLLATRLKADLQHAA